MRRLPQWLLVWGLALGCATPLLAEPQASPSAPAATPASTPADVFRVQEGERVVLELEDSLHTRTSRKGDQARFSTVNEVLSGYRVAIPPGSTVRATLTKVKRPGRLAGRAEIRLRFDEIILPDGTALPFDASILRAGFRQVDNKNQEPSLKGEGSKGRDLTTIGLGGAQGAILGAAIGGKKGAAYGGAVGAGIGLLSVLLQRGPDLDLPHGMLFEVELGSELAVPAASAAQWAHGTRPAAPPSPAASPSSGGFAFPGDFEEEEEVTAEAPPDFGDDDSATVASTRETTPPTPPAAEEPLPPGLDPTLGDPDAYKLRVDVQLVMVEAFVRDDRGRPLDNLAREDFRLLEDDAEQQIRHFSRDELPLAVALVVDRSGSVEPYMPELRRAAYQTLSKLKRGDQVALFAFATDVQRLENLTTNRRRIAERIARIRAGGGTNITDAIFDAAYYLSIAAPDRQRAIILISDNQATTRGRASQSQAIRMALESGVVVYSIKTPGDSTPLTLRLPAWIGGAGSVRKITRETGGEIIDVDRIGSLEAALATVISRLKTRYTLGYHSTNKARDGAFRRIEVLLADRHGRPDRDYSVHARRGYYAPNEQVASQSQPAPKR